MTDRDLALQSYLNNPCPATRNVLIAHHHGLINFVMNKYMRVPLALRTDAFQEGIIGLCRGIERYDPTKGGFVQYAISWIRASIQKWMEREVRETKCVTISHRNRLRDHRQRLIAKDSARSHVDTEIVDPAPGPYESAMTIANRKRVRELLSQLTVDDREEAIIKENIYNDIPLIDLAARFGLSKQRMYQIKTDLLRRVENSLEPEESRC